MAAKVLIVEDEPLIALEIESILSDAGFAIAGCVASVDKALAVLEREDCDAAVLDANLRGESIEAVALALDQRNKPFCFVSGYGRVYLPAPFQEAPLLSKPFAPDALVQAVSRLLA